MIIIAADDTVHGHAVQVFFTPLSQSLRLIIHLGEPLPEGTDFLFDFGALTCLFFFSFTLMMWTNGVGASTGMFVPALAVGAVGMCPCPVTYLGAEGLCPACFFACERPYPQHHPSSLALHCHV